VQNWAAMFLRSVCLARLCVALWIGSSCLGAWSELRPGHWEGKPEGVDSQRSYMFEVGPPTDRRFTFASVSVDGTHAEVVASGMYEVTADEGEPHLTLHVERIYRPETGQDELSAEFSGWTLAAHEDARVVLTERGNEMLVDALAPDSSALAVRFRLRALGATPL
jgi:hypothetical protein